MTHTLVGLHLCPPFTKSFCEGPGVNTLKPESGAQHTVRREVSAIVPTGSLSPYLPQVGIGPVATVLGATHGWPLWKHTTSDSTFYKPQEGQLTHPAFFHISARNGGFMLLRFLLFFQGLVRRRWSHRAPSQGPEGQSLGGWTFSGSLDPHSPPPSQSHFSSAENNPLGHSAPFPPHPEWT